MNLPKFQKRKGISPLIATLLLIAIAVAASVLTYSWVMSMIGSQSAQAQTQVRVDAVTYVKAATTIKVDLRNTGSTDATLESVWLRKNVAGQGWATYNATLCSVISCPVGAATPVTVSPITALTAGASYICRVTTNTGFYYEFIFTSPP